MLPSHLGNGEQDQPRRSSSNAARTYKFPDYQPYVEDVEEPYSREGSPRPLPNGLPQGMHSSERWPARKANGWMNGGLRKNRQDRQKSLSEAIQTVRTRRGSVRESAHEIAESLKAPVSYRLIGLCAFWYATSILTNTSSKAILTALPKPVTLTIVQFLLVSFWCIFLSWMAKHNAVLRKIAPVLKNGIRKPSRELILATLPLTAFQIGGHILNSSAMQRIPVSLVHTIKGLSPLMTVIAYRAFYAINYSKPVYLSLIPLTVGVCLACAADFRANLLGLIYAFGSAILFVTQNIVSKQIFNASTRAEADGQPLSRRKPDKLNLLCYSSLLACLFTAPIWFFSEGWTLAQDFFQDSSITLADRPDRVVLDHGALAAEFIFNGTFHFAQSLVAFVLLGMVSPVTYSVASLIKRVAVIMFAVVWWGKAVTGVQAVGFGLTFVGLYLYDRTHGNAGRADKRARELAAEGLANPLLPLSTGDAKKHDDTGLGSVPPPYYAESPAQAEGGLSALGGLTNGANLSNGDLTYSRPRASTGSRASPSRSPHRQGADNASYGLPSGIKAAETWRSDEKSRDGVGVR
nr:hypothetical protein B0A51_00215 [Rachicladosporium sp. CCFEE 5018]